VLCVTLAVPGDSARELARYDRGDVLAGEYWRLLSGHFVHLGWGHTWLNVAALLIVGMLFSDVLRTRDWLASVCASILAIDIGLLWLEPDVEWYVGLSGALHGLVAAGALHLVARRERLGLVLVLGLCAKLVYEQAFGALPLTAATSGGPVLVVAHLYGAIGGACAAALALYLRRRGSRL
jgi:rhomboid family GlyGly-CTERM serine protease